MAALLLLATFGVALVLSQATHNTGSFTYQGCSTVDLSCFGNQIVFSDSRLTPAACQMACQGHQFAALFPDSCRCGDDANAIRPVDESKCDHPCMGDPKFGMCGSICPENSPIVANIYTRAPSPTQEPGYGEPAGPQTPSAPVETPCSSTEAGPPGESPGSSPRITPGGPAPQPPTSLASPPTQVPQESPCPSQDPTVGTPAPPAQGTQIPSGTPPEPKTFSGPSQPAPDTTSSPGPSNESPECQSSPVSPYSDGHNPGGPGEEPSTRNCKPPGGSDLSPAPSESTLWPRPGGTTKPDGDPPVPSLVPGSDSTHGIIPPLSSIGGLALLAAIII